jgi:large repetitive protein
VARTYYTIDGGGQQTYGAPFDISAEGPHTITYWSVDVAGNAEDHNTGQVNVDLTKPTTTADGLDDGTVWTNAPRTVTLSAGDGAGSGVAHTYYTVDGAGPQLYDGSFTIDWDGVHTVTFWSVDAAGNIEDPTTSHASIDGTSPTASAEGFDAAWHRHPVAVTLRAFDLAVANDVQGGLGLPALPSSGVKDIQYRDGLGPWVTVGSDVAPVNVTSSAIHHYQYRAEDFAGNVSPIGSFTVKVDTIKPAVVCYTNTIVVQGGVAKVRYRLADNLSTKLTCRLVITQYGKIKAVYPLGLKPVNTTLTATVRSGLKAQPYYWRVDARDAAGNERWGIHHLFIIAPRQLR